MQAAFASLPVFLNCLMHLVDQVGKIQKGLLSLMQSFLYPGLMLVKLANVSGYIQFHETQIVIRLNTMLTASKNLS